MLQRLIQWFKSLFKNPAPTVTVQSPTQTLRSADPIDRLDNKEGWEAWRNTFAASTRSFIPTWEEKLARDARIVVQPGIDQSGFDITEAKGWEVRNNLPSGTYTFTLGKPGTVIVTGFAGGYVFKVNGEDCFNYRHLFNQSGSVTLEVEVVGAWRVQVV